jgi:hypothetical protein
MILGNGKHERNWLDLDTSSHSEVIGKTAGTLIDSFFKRLKIKGASEAIERLLASNLDIDAGCAAALNLKRRFVSIHENSGSFMEYRLLKKGFIDDDIGVYCYLLKYEKSFYRLVFTFYNNSNSVKLYKFLFDDNLGAELERSLQFSPE